MLLQVRCQYIFLIPEDLMSLGCNSVRIAQGGRSWLPFGEGKNCHTNFRQAHIYYFRDKCVVFASNCKFAHLQYIPYISAKSAQKKHTFCPKIKKNA